MTHTTTTTHPFAAAGATESLTHEAPAGGPTPALDRARSREVVQLLAAQSRERGVVTVMVTHDHDVLDHCDRVLEMVDGRLGNPA